MALDFTRLMRFRLVIARYGEMDGAQWWNTRGVLGRTGDLVFQRGFPRTASFAQARVAFAVARARCAEIFNPIDCMTLWSLPAETEERFEEEWYRWLDQSQEWDSFFQSLKEPGNTDLLDWLEVLGLTTAADRDAALRLRRSSEGRAVALPGIWEPNNDAVTLLTAGFCCGGTGSPAIPYARLVTV